MFVSFPVQPTRSSGVASASSPSAHDFALLPSFLPSYYRLRILELFLSSKMVGMKSISFESLDGLVNEMRAAETIRRLRCHLGNLLIDRIDRIDRIDLPISGNGSYLGFSFVFINRKGAETNSRPCLETVSAVHSAAAHGHRPL